MNLSGGVTKMCSASMQLLGEKENRDRERQRKRERCMHALCHFSLLVWVCSFGSDLYS